MCLLQLLRGRQEKSGALSMCCTSMCQRCMCVQNWDGSGGNGAAMRHFEATGQKYPLVVKLGTITPNGADVYSYASDENDMVEDPDLVSPSKVLRSPLQPGSLLQAG